MIHNRRRKLVTITGHMQSTHGYINPEHEECTLCTRDDDGYESCELSSLENPFVSVNAIREDKRTDGCPRTPMTIRFRFAISGLDSCNYFLKSRIKSASDDDEDGHGSQYEQFLYGDD